MTVVAAALSSAILLAGATADVQAREPSKPTPARLIVPADSPVRLRSLDEDDATAEFSGRFVLSGEFSYGCTDECTKPFAPKDMRMIFAPDPELAARLPRWRGYGAPSFITIDNSAAFASKVISTRTMQGLRYGRQERVTGQISMIVDRFRTDIACDSAEYSARFVGLAKSASLKLVRLDGDHGCE